MPKDKSRNILYSCYQEISRKGENYVPNHTISFQISGDFVLLNGSENYIGKPGSTHLIARDQLVKFTKYPDNKGTFESLNIYLDQHLLKAIAKEYRFVSNSKYDIHPMVLIEENHLIRNALDTLKQLEDNDELNSDVLVDLKIKELVLLILQKQPNLKDLLFDFNEPHKIDLKEFMLKNYRYNVKLERLAYLTGRSLASFKRDFEKTFKSSPHKWILEKRLEEAHLLIRDQGKLAIEIYLDLGFEDLSHFSYVFKRQFGYSPRNIPS